MRSLGDKEAALLVQRTNAARLSSPEDWRDKPTEAFKKFIRATPSQGGRDSYSNVSVLQYEAKFKRFFDFMAAQSGIDILNIDVVDISTFLAELQGREPAQPGSRDPNSTPDKWVARTRTKDDYAKLLDIILDGLVLAGYREANPVPEAIVLAGYRETNPVLESLGDENVARLAASANAVCLSSFDDWSKNPVEAFQKFIRTIPFGREEGAYSDASVLQYESEFRQFNDFLIAHAGMDVLNIGVDHILQFVAELQGRGRAQPASRDADLLPIGRAAQTRTKDRYVKLLVNVFNGLVLAGYRTDNPALEARQRLESPEGEAEAEIIFLSENEDERFTEYLMHEHPVSTWRERRRRAMLLFIHRTGVECSVARRATVDDFVLDDGAPGFKLRIDPVPDSTANYYRLPLDEFCIEGMLEWVKERTAYLNRQNPKDQSGLRLAFPRTEKGAMLLNTGLWRGVSGCLKAIGVDGESLGGRVLRNTFIRRQILSGKSNAEVQHLAGLNSVTTIQRLRRMG